MRHGLTRVATLLALVAGASVHADSSLSSGKSKKPSRRVVHTRWPLVSPCAGREAVAAMPMRGCSDSRESTGLRWSSADGAKTIVLQPSCKNAPAPVPTGSEDLAEISATGDVFLEVTCPGSTHFGWTVPSISWLACETGDCPVRTHYETAAHATEFFFYKTDLASPTRRIAEMAQYAATFLNEACAGGRCSAAVTVGQRAFEQMKTAKVGPRHKTQISWPLEANDTKGTFACERNRGAIHCSISVDVGPGLRLSYVGGLASLSTPTASRGTILVTKPGMIMIDGDALAIR